MTDRGADYCFECVGMASLVREAYASYRKGWGKTIVVGVDKPGARLSFSRVSVLELHLDEFVTHEVEFKNINKAFHLLSKLLKRNVLTTNNTGKCGIAMVASYPTKKGLNPQNPGPTPPSPVKPSTVCDEYYSF
ncbi:hypothetical protein RYX36_020964 [Vicia faba]